MNLKERTYLWYIALLRIYIGYYLRSRESESFSGIFRTVTGSVDKSAISPPSTCTRGTKSFSLTMWCRIKSCSVILLCLVKF